LKSTDRAIGKAQVFAATADKVIEQHRTGQAVGVLLFDQGEVNSAFVDYILAKDGTCKCRSLVHMWYVATYVNYAFSVSR
jgi:hypothetical protein